MIMFASGKFSGIASLTACDNWVVSMLSNAFDESANKMKEFCFCRLKRIISVVMVIIASVVDRFGIAPYVVGCQWFSNSCFTSS